MELLNRLKEKTAAIILWIVEKFRHCTDIVKTSGEKNRITGEIRRHYENLGRTIYESKGEDMSACREICDKIDVLHDRMEELTARDAVLRRRVRCPRCGAVMNRKAKFCSECGGSMPEITTEE